MSDKRAKVYKTADLMAELGYKDVTLREAAAVHTIASSHKDVKAMEQKVTPIVVWVKANPKLAWFVADSNAAKLGQAESIKIKKENPNISHDGLMSQLMGRWYDILLKFAKENGYVDETK